VRRAHLQVIWLLLSGEAGSAVARVTGFSVRWIEKLVARWNAEGPAGLGDRRRGNGAALVLDEGENVLPYQIVGKADTICAHGKETDTIQVWIQQCRRKAKCPREYDYTCGTSITALSGRETR